MHAQLTPVSSPGFSSSLTPVTAYQMLSICVRDVNADVVWFYVRLQDAASVVKCRHYLASDMSQWLSHVSVCLSVCLVLITQVRRQTQTCCTVF